MTLRLIYRFASTVLLLVLSVFFVVLTMELGQAGGLAALPSSIGQVADFTVEYLAGLVRGDLGTVARSHSSAPVVLVTSELRRALPRSLGLLGLALALGVVIGLPLGISAALRRETRLAERLVFLAVLGVSTPSYLAAALLIWSSVWLQRVTGIDLLPIHGFGWDARLVLPTLVLATRPAAHVMRLGHNAVAEVLDADFVRTAHAKGLRPRVVLFRHVLRSAGVPLLTTVAVSVRFSLAILPIVEYIFSWSGVGQRLLEAIQVSDVTTAVGLVIPLALLFALVNLLLDVLYLVVDPRLRMDRVGAA